MFHHEYDNGLNRPFPSCCEPHYESEAKCKTFHKKISFENDVLFLKVTQAYSEKNPSAPIRSRTQDLPITSSDALLLSYRRLVGAKAIKLGSWDKYPAYC